MSRWQWGVILALGGLLLFGIGAGPADAGETPSSRYGMDAREFSGELQSRGAFQFAEDTEDRIRSGQFELAFARYLFLKAHIRGQRLYMALNAMVDQRLHWLKTQMGLGEIPTYAAPYKKLKRRVRREAPPVTSATPDQKDGKVSAKPEITPAAAKKPEEAAPPTTPPVPTPVQPPPKEEAPEEKPEAKKPAPPPSRWERIKRRLKFWE